MDRMESAISPSQKFSKRHGLPLIIILLFFILSYLIISSDYNFVHGDTGIYARSAKIFYETNKIDITGTAASELGQLLFSAIFCKLFGFKFKILHITVYIVNFLSLVAMYLLLTELGLKRFLALFGSLTLLINPISIKMIDWYMTEPFFIFYLIFSLLFVIKAFRLEKIKYLYVGSVFCVFGILTRQHAVSVPAALILLGFFYRKRINKNLFIHCLISSIIPILSILLFYLYIFSLPSSAFSTGLPKDNIAIIKRFLNPLFLFKKLFFDTLFSLHYSVLYISPLLIILFIGLLMNPKKLKEISTNLTISIISTLFFSIGTFILYFKHNRLMPYIPSIFSINSLTEIFNFSVLNKISAAYILTLFTFVGGIILLIKILEYFLNQKGKKYILNKKKEKREKAAKLKQQEKTIDFGERFFYLWGIILIFVTIFIGLRYDRYIWPVSILIIYVILSHFSWIEAYKKTFIIVFILIFSVFIYKIASRQLSLDLQWEAGYSLLNEDISSQEINCGLGFNLFYNLDYIKNLYKDVKVKRRINWYKFHPLARFFVLDKPKLDKRNPGLILYRSFSKKRLFGLLQKETYIYKRKDGYLKPIWV